MKRRPQTGVYALLVQVLKRETIGIGRLGPIRFDAGTYVYIGSALNSLEGRISRHFRTAKQKHWHIDYLTCSSDVRIVGARILPTTHRVECRLAKAVQKRAGNIVPMFGSSDCDCSSHLFYFRNPRIASEVLSEIGFTE
jgi:Uri superfamily endonuclease